MSAVAAAKTLRSVAAQRDSLGFVRLGTRYEEAGWQRLRRWDFRICCSSEWRPKIEARPIVVAA